MTKINLSYRSILFFLLGLYTVLPDYFKIVGQNSALICGVLIIGIYLFRSFTGIVKLDKTVSNFCIIYLIVAGSMHIIHKEWTQAIRVLLENCIILLIVYRLIRTKEDYQRLIKSVVRFAVFEALTTFVHFFGDFNVFSLIQSANLPAYSLESTTQYRNGMVRVEGSFGHAITFAIYISICACLCLYIYNTEKKKKYLVYYFICVASLLMSISRMPILVFLASQFIYLMSINYKKTLNIIFKILMIAVPLIIIMTLIMPKMFSMLMQIVNLVIDVFSVTGLSGLTSYEYDSAFTYRAEMIRVLPELIKEKPLFGIGGESYRSPSFYFLINGTKQTSIDNEYFHHLLLYGFWGLAGLLWWIFGSVFWDKSPKDKAPKEKTLRLYKILIIFVYAVNLFSVAMMFEYKLIIVLFAIFLADIRIRKSEVI